MEYNDTNYYTYSVCGYEHGWKVYHVEDGNIVTDMCYATEDVANAAAVSLNVGEAKRVARAKERLARFNNYIGDTSLENFYGVRGRYYGD